MSANVESTVAGGGNWGVQGPPPQQQQQDQQSALDRDRASNASDSNSNSNHNNHNNNNNNPLLQQRPLAAAPDMNFEQNQLHLQQQQQQQQLQQQQQQQQPPSAASSRQYPPQQFHQQLALSQAASPSPQHPLNQLQSQPQQQHHPQQQPHHPYSGVNGVNGANMGPPAPMPTPAGHQAELNYIYGMVEELSRQLSDNRRVTEDIVTGLGRVRNRARSHAMSNEDLMAAAGEEMNADDQNLDALVSVLSESLEKANHSRDANATLLSQYANAVALMLKQFHEYKAMHVADVASWHRSYRVQLDEARRENCRLREQVWEMQTHAGRANECLRRFRRSHEDDEARWASRVDDTATRQELRFWKRMAMPELDDDDPYWSDDDDIIDVAEKRRQSDLELVAAQEQLLDSQAADDDAVEPVESADPAEPPPLSHMVMLGGTAMQRDESGGRPAPVPPPRPLSAASSTGSTGQQ